MAQLVDHAEGHGGGGPVVPDGAALVPTPGKDMKHVGGHTASPGPRIVELVHAARGLVLL